MVPLREGGPAKPGRESAKSGGMVALVGYQSDACGEFTLLRNGTCLKCDTCGSTTGCS
jgi:ribonucleoside-diphosphate reductase alpha chain